jgi:RNA polymerase sigma factor (sigma-70 family)
VTASFRGSAEVKLLGELAPQVLGVLMRRFGAFSAAEDALQEALLAAATRWPRRGVPDNPRAWLISVASRRLIDQLRSETARRRRETEWMATELPHPYGVEEAEAEGVDDTLILLFMCCHPALTQPSAIALTLRAVGGLTTAEIARAFLVPEATMAQRISRAKQSIADSRIPFALPTESEMAKRLSSVLHVLYLIFNEGYASSAGSELQRVDLSREAIRLTRAVRASLPKDGEVAGLLALMLLTDARRPARTGDGGELIPLDEQNRSLWDHAEIEEGVALISAALASGFIGSYQIQAAIAAVHDEAQKSADTDWPQILTLYGLLMRMSDNPMVALNHAVAAAMVHGPAAGLRLLANLDGDKRLVGLHRLDAVRAHLYEMAGDVDAAISLYVAAAGRTTSSPERDYLTSRAARLRDRDKINFVD